MNESNMAEFFKGVIDSGEGPIIICDLDYRIVYMNPAAAGYYIKGRELVGRLLETLMDEEMMSKVRMSVEWFKEDKDSKKVFIFHDEKNNMDMYILAIRNENNELIGFFGRHEDRNPEQSKELCFY